MMGDDRHQRALGQRATAVAHRVQRLGRLPLDLGEIVPPRAHGVAQLGVGDPGLLGRGRRPGALPAQLAVQRDQVFQHVAGHPGADLQVGQAQVAEERVALRLLQRDLKLRTAARRLRPQQLVRGHRQRLGQRLDQ